MNLRTPNTLKRIEGHAGRREIGVLTFTYIYGEKSVSNYIRKVGWKRENSQNYKIINLKIIK